jgi:hypothetical protein
MPKRVQIMTDHIATVSAVVHNQHQHHNHHPVDGKEQPKLLVTGIAVNHLAHGQATFQEVAQPSDHVYKTDSAQHQPTRETFAVVEEMSVVQTMFATTNNHSQAEEFYTHSQPAMLTAAHAMNFNSPTPLSPVKE